MRLLVLIATLTVASCLSPLSAGDRAFTAGKWHPARVYWNMADGPDDEVALRLAVLHADPQSPYFDPLHATELFEVIARTWPATPAGKLAARLIRATEQANQAQEKAVSAEGALLLAEQRLAQLKRQAALVRAQDAEELEASEEARRALMQELERLRAELASRATLVEENEALRQELEALKLIDLRR